MRMVSGCLVHEAERDKIKDFLAKNKDHKFVEFPKCEAMHTSFPFRNFLSYMFMPMRVYPALEKTNNSIKRAIP